jgi:hypothetical protein
MKTTPWTRSDLVYLAIVSGPLVVLLAMFAVGSISWRSQQGELDRAWTAATAEIGGDVDELTLARWYDDRTSKDHTADFKIAVSAAESVFGRLHELNPNYDVFAPLSAAGDSSRESELIHHFAADTKPIISRIKRLADADSTHWNPFVFQGLDTLLIEVQETSQLSRILQLEFVDAYVHDQSERALEALRLMGRLFGPVRGSFCLVDEVWRISHFARMQASIRQSLAHDFWTPAQLDALQQMVSVKVDWNQRWRDINRGELMFCYSTIRNPQAIGRFGPIGQLAIIAPDEVRALIEHRHRVGLIDGAGTQKHAEAVEQAEQQYFQGADPHWSPDSWIQFPLLNGKWLANAVLPYHAMDAQRFVNAAVDQRWTRCAIAIKQFQVQYNRFPKSLAELSKIGFVDNSDGLFSYEISDDALLAKLSVTSRTDVDPEAANTVEIR